MPGLFPVNGFRLFFPESTLYGGDHITEGREESGSRQPNPEFLSFPELALYSGDYITFEEQGRR